MARGKTSDRKGLLLELLTDAGLAIQQRLVAMYNEMLTSGHFPRDWQGTLFILLPKSGDLSDPNNWRPIVILEVSYKMLTRLLYDRMKSSLGQRQSDEQYGFRPSRSYSYALTVLGSIISKFIGWIFSRSG